jgi:hypothetical protein
MSIGAYAITIEDEDGRAVRLVERTTTAGRPVVGEDVEVDGALYRVRAVRHDQVDDRTVRVYTRPRLFVRPVRRRVPSVPR